MSDKYSLQDIEKLDAERTQGAWEYVYGLGGKDTHAIMPKGRRCTDDSILYEDGIYPIELTDMHFIAATPAIIRQLLDDHETMRRALEEIERCVLNPQHIARKALRGVTK